MASICSSLRFSWVALVVALLAGAPAAAATATYTLTSDGLTGILAGNAVACDDVPSCPGGSLTNASVEGASGVLDIVDTASPGFPDGTLSVSIPSITLTGGPVSGLDTIVLTGLSATFVYPSFGLLESPVGAGLLSIIDLGPVSATLSGTVEGFSGGGSVSGPTAFSETADLSALACIVSPGQCGFQIDFTTAALGDAFDVRLTANLNAVPEPHAIALVGTVALAAVAARRRRLA